MKKKAWFEGGTALVTGASDGIGREISRLLIRDFRCRVIGVGRSKEKLDALALALGEDGELFSPVSADVADGEFWGRIAAENADVDLVINNAGVMPPFGKIADLGEDVFLRTAEVNLFSVFRSMKSFLPILRRNGGGMVNISSAAALCPLAGTGAYSATKTAVLSLSEAVAAEERDVYIGVVCPGFTKTALFRDSGGFFDVKIIAALSSTVEKMAAKIVRGIAKKRRRMIFGADAKALHAFHKVFPTLSADTVRAVMLASGLEVFSSLRETNEGENK